MQRKKVISSNINSIGYNKKKTLLEVEFYSGVVYQYHPVDEDTYNALMNAESVGAQFSKSIKNNKDIKFHKMD